MNDIQNVFDGADLSDLSMKILTKMWKELNLKYDITDKSDGV